MFWIIALGIATGMRTMTPITVLCWFMGFALLPVHGWTLWAAKMITVIVFTLGALSEYYVDTLPQTPSRTRLTGVVARLVSAALTGAMVASVFQEPIAGGIVFGCLGALIGTYGAHALRAYFSRLVGRDLPVALCESVLALVLAVLALNFIHMDIQEAAGAARTFF
ncbi:MAG TPA: DUF4126 domain-containing protein [Granulicella sp.]|jgi:uncharacterized membrane protein